ncbi:MATE efflux family protein, partial [Prunus dulcis]
SPLASQEIPSNRGIGVDPTNLSVPLSIVDPRGQRKGTTKEKRTNRVIYILRCVVKITGHLDNAVIAVGSLSICVNINGFELMLFIGINVAISVRVSNELGSGRPRAAKYSVYVTVFQCLLIGIFFMIVILITKDSFSLLFTSDKDLQQAVAKLAYLLASSDNIRYPFDALVAYINLGCYYIFGLPLGYLLGYIANLGVMRLCGGMICGTALQTLLLMIVLYKTNWNKERPMHIPLFISLTVSAPVFGLWPTITMI